MRGVLRYLAVLLLVAGALGAATLFTSATQSTWSVAQGGNVIGKITMTTDGSHVRVDWKPSAGAPASFVGTDGKIWIKGTGGDEELAKAKPDAVTRAVVPALMLPTTTSSADKVATSGAKVTTYAYGGGAATYAYDAKGPNKIEVTSGATKYTLTRDSVSAGTGAMATFYEVKPKASRLGALRAMAGGLTGQSDTSVSASAGVRGMDPATAMKAGIDLGRVDQLLARDAKSIDADLKKFQKEGKVGGAQ